jgi:hypothetical protein
MPRRRPATPDGDPRLVDLNPAPESALPLIPLVRRSSGAEVEVRALLMRAVSERRKPEELLSVHTLGGQLDAPLRGPIGARGEYEVSFTPHRAGDPRQLVLASFRFAPVSDAAAGAGAGVGPDLILELGVPRRIQPPMEPGEGGALVLQVEARLGGRRGAGA